MELGRSLWNEINNNTEDIYFKNVTKFVITFSAKIVLLFSIFFNLHSLQFHSGCEIGRGLLQIEINYKNKTKNFVIIYLKQLQFLV